MTIIMLAVYRGYHGYVQIDSAMDGRTRSECSNGVERKEIVAIAIGIKANGRAIHSSTFFDSIFFLY